MSVSQRHLRKRILAAMIAVILIFSPGIVGNLLPVAASGTFRVEVTTDELLLSLEQQGQKTEAYEIQSTTTVTVLNEQGELLDTYPSGEGSIYASYQLESAIGEFLQDLAFPYEPDSVSARMELMEALKGKTLVKTARAGEAVVLVVVDPGTEALTAFAVNMGRGKITVELVVLDADGRELDPDEISVLFHNLSKENLTPEQLERYRFADGTGVEVLEILETVTEVESDAGETDGQSTEEQEELEEPSDSQEEQQEEAERAEEDSGVKEGNEEEPTDTFDNDEDIEEDDKSLPEEPVDSGEEMEESADREGGSDHDEEKAGSMEIAPMRIQPMRIGGGAGISTGEEGAETEEETAGTEEELGEETGACEEAESGQSEDGGKTTSVTTIQEYVAVISRESSGNAHTEGNRVSLTIPGNTWAELTVDMRSGLIYSQPENHTVTFIPNNGQPEWEETVETGEAIREPGLPTVPQGMTSFIGWFVEGSPADSRSYDFSTPVLSGLRLEARYSEHYVVQFKNAPVNGKVICTQLVPKGQLVQAYDPGPEDLELGEGMTFSYWYIEGGDEAQPFVFGTMIGDNLTLVPELSGSHYVIFQSGGTPVETAFVKGGELVEEPVPPVRSGFDFLYWSETEAGSAYDFGTAVERNLTLYGVWKGHDNTPYTLVHWVEKPNLPDGPQSRSDYIYGYSERKAGTAGEVVHITSKDDALLDDFYDWRAASSNVTHALVYSTFSHSDKAEIYGDGTTIVNVYHKRNVYTLTFDLGSVIQYGTEENPVGTGLYPRIVMNGRNYTGSEYSITVKYEQDIADLWPVNEYLEVRKEGEETWTSIDGSGYALVHWDPTKVPGGIQENKGDVWATKRLTVTHDLLPNDPELREYTVTAGYTVAGTIRNVTYWFEMLEDGQEEQGETQRIFDGAWYEIDPAYNSTLYDGKVLYPKAIEGMRFYAYSSSYDDPNYDPAYPKLFYRRNSYKLSFDTQGGYDPIDEWDYRYEQLLEEPTEPWKDGYIFAGWYGQPDFTGPSFDFEEAIMPAHDLKLFARWDSTDNTITFYTDRNAARPFAEQGVENGYTVDLTRNNLPQVGDWDEERGEFLGWLWEKNGALVQYPSVNPVYGSFSLYGNWKDSGFTVTYNVGEGAGTPPVDTNTYKVGTAAQIQPPDGVVHPARSAFVGWRVNGVGQTYYPYNLLPISGSMVLVARYVDQDDSALLRYHANGGTGSDVSITVEKGADVTLLGENAFTREGYTLVGWSKTDGANSKEYDLDGTIQIWQDTDLYAVWERNTYTVTFQWGPGGALTGTTHFTVAHGALWANEVEIPTAAPNSGYYFAGWSPALPGDDHMVTSNETYQAMFLPQTKLTIQANSEAKRYDGTPLVASGYTVTPDLPVDVYITGLSVSGFITDVGIASAILDYQTAPFAILDGTGADITEQFSVEFRSGTLEVTAAEVLIIGESGARVYDGTEHILDSYDVTGLIDGHTLTGAAAYGAGVLPGNYPVQVTLEDVRIEETSGREVTRNYTFSTMDGRLTIHPPGEGEKLSWQVTADSGSYRYNGLTQQVAGFTTDLPDGYKVTGLEAVGSGKDVGVYPVTASIISGGYGIFDEHGNDVTAYYKEPVVKEGTLEITPVPLTIKADDWTIGFDAPPPAYTLSYTGFVNGETADVLKTPAVVQCPYTQGSPVGTYTITPSGAEAENYTIAYETGTLTVVVAEGVLKAAAEDVTVVYDSLPHGIQVKVSGVNGAQVDYRLPGGAWSATHPTLVNVSDSSLVEYRVNCEGYATVTGAATVTIQPRPIAVQANSASRTYTGSVITVNTGARVVRGTLAGNHVLTAQASGSGTLTGVYPIVLDSVAVYGDTIDVTDNYAIDRLDGALTISRSGTGGSGGGSGGTDRPDTDGGSRTSIQDGDVPLGSASVTIEDDAVPLGALPSAGGIPVEAFIGLGALMVGSGTAYKIYGRKKDRGRDDVNKE